MVTGLLVIIIVALSAILLQQRGRYQRQVVQLKKTISELQMLSSLGGGTSVDAAVSQIQLMASKSEEPQFEVVREELATVPMNVNGKNVRVLQLSGTLGRRAGFVPGDLIYVTEPPAAKPVDEKQIPAVK
jgi:hypothetical protein